MRRRDWSATSSKNPVPIQPICELRLRERVPAHLVPSDIVVVDSIPLTPNGKLDRGALPAPPARAAARAPRTEMERQLCQVFARVLGVEAVDPEESFFDLGGDSLRAMRLVGEMEHDLSVSVGVGTLMARPTVAELAAHLDESASEIDLSRDRLLTLRAEGSGEPLFCVHPAGGFAWPFAPLTGVLEADRPLFGLQLPTVAGEPPRTDERGPTGSDVRPTRFAACNRAGRTTCSATRSVATSLPRWRLSWSISARQWSSPV